MKLHTYIIRYIKNKYNIIPNSSSKRDINYSTYPNSTVWYIDYIINDYSLYIGIPILDRKLIEILDTITVEYTIESIKNRSILETRDVNLSYVNYRGIKETPKQILDYLIDKHFGNCINKFKFSCLL